MMNQKNSLDRSPQCALYFHLVYISLFLSGPKEGNDINFKKLLMK